MINGKWYTVLTVVLLERVSLSVWQLRACVEGLLIDGNVEPLEVGAEVDVDLERLMVKLNW